MTMKDLYKNVFVHSCWIFILCLCTSPSLFGNASTESLSLELPETAVTDVELTIHNDGFCPVDIFQWLDSGDVYFTTLEAGDQWTITTTDGEKWRALSSPADFGNLQFDEYYLTDNSPHQDFYVNPTYCGSCEPEVTVCNSGECPMHLIEWLPTGDEFLGTIQPSECQTVVGYHGMKFRFINTDPDWNDLIYDQHEMVSGCDNVTFNPAPNYCLPDCILNCPADILVSCEDSVDPSQTGMATVNGPNCIDPIITYTDEYDGSSCPQVITRTWQLDASVATSNPCVPQTVAQWDFAGSGDQNLCQAFGGNPLAGAGVPASSTNGNGCSGFSVSSVQKEGKSSCVQGAFGGSKSAACVGGQDNSSFNNNDSDAIEFTASFGSNDEGRISSFCFYERAVENNENFGQNWPPRKYGIRVLKNGSEIFRSTGNNTTSDWSQECFDFGNNPEFNYNGVTTFKFELLGYDPEEDRLDPDENIWEIDEFNLMACCGDLNTTINQTITCVQKIEILDNQFPTITNVPADVTITCSDEIPALPQDLIAGDNCSFETEFTETITGDEPCDYIITRTWTAFDECNNTTTESMTITVVNDVDVTITKDLADAICDGDEVTLTADGSGGCAPYTYAWSDNLGSSASVTVTPSENKTYSVTITDADGCSDTASMNVLVNPDPTSGITGEPISCTENEVSFSAVTPQPGDSFSWDFDGGITADGDTDDANESVYWPSSGGEGTRNITLTVTSADGCVAEFTSSIEIEYCMSIGSTVWLDFNNNGQLDAGEPSVDNKTINVRLLDASKNVLESQSISDGNYFFDGLAPGEYFVEIDAPASAPVSSTPTNTADDQTDNDDNGIQSDSDGDGLTDGPIRSGLITLTPNSEPSGAEEDGKGGAQDNSDDKNGDMTVDFGLVPLSSVGSTIFVDLDNDGVRGPNDPSLDDKEVIVRLLDENKNVIATQVVNDGNYFFDNLLPGNYFVEFDAPDSFPVSSTTTNTNDDQTDDDDNGIQSDSDGDGLTDGPIRSPLFNLTPNTEPVGEDGKGGAQDDAADKNGDMTIDFGVVPLGSLGSTVWVDINNNGIIDAGEPTADDKTIVVRLLDENKNVLDQTTTDAIGNYFFGNLLPGNYFIEIDAPASWPVSSTPTNTNDDQVDNDDNGIQSDSDGDGLTDGPIRSPLISLTPGFEPVGEDGKGGAQDDAAEKNGDMTIDFGLVPLSSVGSTIFVDNDNDGIQGPNDPSLDDKTIVVRLLDENKNVLETQTITNGVYFFDNLLPGNYFVEFDAPDSFPVSSTTTNTNDDGTDNDDNGIQSDSDGDGLTDGPIRSPLFNLTPTTEPSGADEDGKGGAQDDAADKNGDMTIDFGVVPLLSIGSTVWLDINNNGILDAGEPSASDKSIVVRLLDEDKNVLESTTTDADGNYFFGSLLPGNYFVEIEAPASWPVSSTPTNTNDDGTDNDDNGIQSDSDGDGLTDGPIRSPLITLAPGTEPSGAEEDGKGGAQDDAADKNGDMTVDFGLVPLSSVGSTIFVDLDNDGIQGPNDPSLDDKSVTVRLLDENKNVLETQVVTNGIYFFDNLLPGNYFVEFDAPDSFPVSSTTTNTNDDGTDNDDNGIQSDSDGDGLTDGPIRSPLFNLTPTTEPSGADEDGKGGAQDDAADKNGDMTIDFGVVPLSSIGSTVWVDINNNGILDAGEPSANDKSIVVRLLDENKNVLEETTTDPDGNYFFGNLLPGNYFVEIEAPASWPVSSTPTNTNDDQTDNDDNGIQSDSDGDGLTDGPIRSPLITLAPGTEPVGEDGKGGAQDDANDKNGDMTVDFGLVPLSSVGSTIFVDNDNDGVQGPNDPSLVGKSVEIRLLDENKNVLETQIVTDGIYFFDNLLPGNYFVEFDAPDSFPVSSTTTNTEDDGTDNDDNGIQSDSDGDGLTDGPIRSPLFNLTPTTEPSGADEDGKGGAQDDAADKNGDMTIDFGLVPLGSLGSTVFVDYNNNGILDAGEPSGGEKTITVRLLDENKNVLEETTTDADGNYFFGNLLPGNYFVEIDAPESLPVSSTPTETSDNDVDNDDNGIQSDSDGDGLTDGPIRSPLITIAPGTEPSGADEAGKGGAQDDANDKNGNMTVDFGLVPLSSVGSSIFVDNNNNGILDDGEPSLDGKSVEVRLLDENKNVLATQVVMDGIYFFDGLLPGNYFVEFDAPDSFPVSSTPTNTNDDGIDNDDNGIQSDSDGDGLTDGPIRSPLFNLTPNSEPSGPSEDGKGGAQDDSADKNGDMTIDFGVVPLSSIGSTVFVDNNNNGILDAGEPSADEKVITVRLLDANKNVLATTTTDENGNYFFGSLLPGDYFVEIDAPESWPVSSTPTNTNDDGTDNDDNGLQSDSDGDGLTDGPIRSPLITLLPGTEPSGADEDGKGGAQDDAEDKNGDMTVDFGLVPLSSVGSTVFIDNDNDGIRGPNDPSVTAKSVTLRLFTEDGTLVATTVTGSDGTYFFDNLLPGNYFIELDAPESLPDSSTPTNSEDDGVDDDDNGSQEVSGGVITSPVFTLLPGSEPSGPAEGGKGGAQDDSADKNGDMTIDFGLRPTVDISLVKEVSNATPNTGEVITFFITVSNDGPYPASGISIEDVLPSGFANPTNFTDGGSANGNIITWNNIDLPFPGSQTVSFDATVLSPTGGGDYNNIAEVTELDQIDTDSDEDNGADTNGNGDIGSEDEDDGSVDAGDEDDGDDECVLVIECPADETLECIEDWNASAVTFSSCCDATVSNTEPVLVTGGPNCDASVYEVTYTVEDCVRSTTCVQAITIENAAPTIVCAADETVACFEDIAESDPVTVIACNLGSTVTTVGPTLISGTDLCDGAVYTIVYTVTDDCGRFAACTQTFTLDVAPPTIECAADETVACFEDIAETAPVTTTSCGAASEVTTVGPTLISGTDLCDGAVYTIVYTVTDACGVTADCTQTFTLDVAPPTIECAADETVACFEDITETAPVTTTSCGAASEVTTVGPTLISGTDLCDGAVYTIVYTVTDACGVTADCTQTFTLDVAPPTIECAADETVACFEDITETAPATTTSCGAASEVTTVGPTLISGTDLCDGAVYTIVYTVTDACGVTAACTQTFTLDVAPPTIECAADETVACFEDIAETAPVTTTSCGAASEVTTVGPTLISGTDLCDGAVYVIVYTVTDACGQSADCTQTFTLDVAPPTIECAADETVACFEDISETAPVTTTSCGAASEVTTVGPTLISGTDLCDGAVYTIVYTVTDACGQSADCTQTFTLEVAPPTISCPADQVVSCIDEIAEGTPVTTTSCGAASEVTTVGPTLVSGDDGCDGAEYSIVYTVTDACGVTAECTQTFTLEVAPPTISCPADQVVSCFDDIQEGTPVTTTSCNQGSTVTAVGPTLVSGNNTCDGAVYEIIYTVTDDCGQSASCTQTFTLDVAAPTISCPADETVSCLEDIAEGTPVTTTACNLDSFVSTAGPTLISGDNGCDGATYEIIYTVTDVCGQTASCTQTFTLDVAAPTIECPADQVVSCADELIPGTPVTTTACGQGSDIAIDGPTLISGAEGCDGAIYEVTYTVTDDCGQSASCVQTWTLEVGAPTIECPADQTVSCADELLPGTPVTTTECGQGSEITIDGPTLISGADGCDGAQYEVTYTVTDDCGQSASCVQTWTLDVAAPTIECPADQTVSCADELLPGTPVTTTECGQGSDVAIDGPTLISGAEGCDGAIYEVTYTVTDDCGQTASCTQTWTLEVGAPTITCPPSETVACFSDITIGRPSFTTECEQGATESTDGPNLVSGTEGCDGAVYEIVYTVTDDCGQSASCVQTWTLDVAAPTIECPADQVVSCLDEIAEGTPVTSTACEQGATVSTDGPNLVSGSDGCNGATYEITYTVTDDCGQSASCVQTWTLEVGEPTIACPADQVVSCFDDILAGTPVTSTSCDQGSTVSTDGPNLVSGADGCDGAIYSIDYTVTDDCGQSASCTQLFTLEVAAPTIACPADATVACLEDIAAGTPVTSTSCDQGSTVSTDGPNLVSGADGCDGAIYSITYTVADDCGQTASCTQTFALSVDGPTISCPADQDVSCVDDIAEGTPTVTTSCGQGFTVETVGPTQISGNGPCDGSQYEIVYTVTDDCGQTASCTQTFTLNVDGPSISCPSDETVDCFSDISEGTPTVTTACNLDYTVATTGPTLVSGTDGCDGAQYEIVYTATDDCGQSASCTQTFTLNVAPPTISCPADAIVACENDIIAGTASTTTSCGLGSSVATAGPTLVSGTAGCDGAQYEIVYTVTDDCGASASCAQTFTLDVAPPTISCPADATVACFSDIAAGTPVTTTACNLGSNVTTNGPTLVSGDAECDGAVYEIEYIITDDCGASASCTQTFTLDVAPPTISCPADATISCLEDALAGTPTATTSCGQGSDISTVGPTLVSGTDGCDEAIYEVEYTVTDDCGATASCTQTFTLEVDAPEIFCPDNATVGCFDEIQAGTATGSTSCNLGFDIEASEPVLLSGNPECDGSVYMIIYTLTDACGDTAECGQQFTLSVAPPTIECPADETVECFEDIVEGTPTTTTACGLGSEVTASAPTFVSGTQGCDGAIYEIEYTITDDCGQTATCTQSFTLNTALPTISCPADATVNCVDDIQEGTPTSTSSCGIASDVSSVGPTLVSGDAGCDGAIYEIVYTVTDDCDRSASCTQTFTLSVEGPTISCPADAVVNCMDQIQAGTPITTAACGTNGNVTTSAPVLVSGNGACNGAIYEITYTVTDNCGQTASCTQSFTLNVEAPTISCPADQNVSCVDEIQAGTAISTASCGQNGTITTSGPTLVSGNGGCDGATYEIVYTVTDDCGQSASCTQSFFLNINGPSITCPADVTVGCGDDIVAGTPTTSSSCGSTATVTTTGPTLVSGTAGCGGAVYEIVYTATDECGQSASCTQTFTTSGGAPSINCPADATVACADEIIAGTPTTGAGCGAGVDVTTSGPTLISGNGGCSGSIYQITYTATDDCGQEASCAQTFTIAGSAPTISCPADATVQCADDIQAGTAVTTGSCGTDGDVTTAGPFLVSGNDGCAGAQYEITYTVTDDCGQQASCTQTFTLVGAATTISCPADATVSCLDDIVAGTATTTGSCGANATVSTTGPTLVSGTPGCDGAIYELVYTATDACGTGSASCTQNFTLSIGAPTISCPAATDVSCVDDIVAGTPTTSSSCSMGNNVTSSAPTLVSGTAGCDGAQYEIVHTVTDDCGGSASCSQIFRIAAVAPSITCPADATVSCVDDITAGTAITNANCSLGTNVSTSGPVLLSGTAGCTGAVYQLTYTATDDCGGSASCTQNFTLNVPAPAITCPADATVACVADIVAGNATSSANCAAGTNITTSAPTLVSGDGCNGSVYQLVYTATDDCGGTATCTQLFTIVSASPSITCPADVTVACLDDIVAGTATTNSACGMGANVTTSFPMLVGGTQGCPESRYEITYTVTDDCGQTASCVQEFTLEGGALTINCPADATVGCVDDITVGTPTTTTGCDFNANVTTSGPTLVAGNDGCSGAVYQVVYTATDDCGGIATCTQEFTILGSAPSITCPADVTVTCLDDFVPGTPTIGASCGAANGNFTVSDLILATGTANCGMSTYNVTYSYFDECSGADLSCTQTVTLDYPGFKIHCPEDITIADDIANFIPGVPDYVGACGPISLSVGDPIFLGSGGPCKEIFIVTYSGTDECGNTVVCTQEVAVESDCILNMGNRVFNDMNNDGIFDAGDEPMPNKRVNLWLETTGDNLPDEFVKYTTTDENGEYMFIDIEPGDYIVEMPVSDLDDNCIPSTNIVLDPDNDMDEMNDAYNPGVDGLRVMTLPITMDYETEPMNDGDEDSNTNLTVDIGLIHTSSLGSYVWEDIDSDGIQDANETGFNGVIARLYEAGDPDNAIDQVTTSTNPATGQDGYFMFTGVIPGSYFLTFELPNGYIFTTPLAGSDNADSNVDGSNGTGSTGIITIGQDEVDVTIAAGIYAASAVGNFVFVDNPGGAMNVADGNDTPLKDVQVTLWDADNNVVVDNTVSDGNGAYLFTDVPAGNYYVEFDAPSGYSLIAPNLGGDDAVDSDADPITRLSHVFAMEPGDTNLTIDAGFSITVDVELIGFDGAWNNEQRISELFWSTASEVNTDYYILERSDLNSNSFREIAEVDARGNSTQEASYDYDDETIVKAGTYYYRLMIVDFNGDMTYSDIVAIDVNDIIDRPQVDLRIYPHATSDILNLEVTTSERFDVSGEVYDMKGALVSPLTLREVMVGENSLQVNVNDFTAGAYIIRVKVGNKVFVERFTKVD